MRRWEIINTSGGGEELKRRLNNIQAEYKNKSPKVEAILTPVPGLQMIVFTYEAPEMAPGTQGGAPKTGEPKP
jgi:hypothetical protein